MLDAFNERRSPLRREKVSIFEAKAFARVHHFSLPPALANSRQRSPGALSNRSCHDDLFWVEQLFNALKYPSRRSAGKTRYQSQAQVFATLSRLRDQEQLKCLSTIRCPVVWKLLIIQVGFRTGHYVYVHPSERTQMPAKLQRGAQQCRQANDRDVGFVVLVFTAFHYPQWYTAGTPAFRSSCQCRPRVPPATVGTSTRRLRFSWHYVIQSEILTLTL